ncbi:MAG: hypothetical protein A2096_11015 [Spirochaetes bacterium GWF1_41_5]|nr:MAG: hypothetical protein A2096_11015 [Spirochaetes bacterium GWF1_41_5]
MKLVILSLAFAFDGISTHKLRSFLTMLGIIFGVAAVVSMLAIGTGAQDEILRKISIMGIDNIYLYDNREIRVQELSGGGKYVSSGISEDDIRALQGIIGKWTEIVPIIDNTMSLQFKNYRGESKTVGTVQKYFDILHLELRLGRFFTDLETGTSAQVAVLGGGLYNIFKREGEVLGEKIKIRDEWFTIVGILFSKGADVKKDDNMDYEDFNHNIYIPFGHSLLASGADAFSPDATRIIIHCRNKDLVGKIGILAERIFLRRHRGLRDFKIVIPEELLKQHRDTQAIFDLVLGSIAGISLLVGGIGIMNIMLASVLERTREIGIRRACGATRTDIRLQFLFESMLLTILGGLFGIFLSFIITRIISLSWKMPTRITLSSCVLSFTISALIGIVFGFFPAKKAADMNPIDALRYE